MSHQSDFVALGAESKDLLANLSHLADSVLFLRQNHVNKAETSKLRVHRIVVGAESVKYVGNFVDVDFTLHVSCVD